MTADRGGLRLSWPVLFLLCVIGGLGWYIARTRAVNDTVARQLAGQLTENEKALLAANAAIAQLRSEIVASRKLEKALTPQERAVAKTQRLTPDAVLSASMGISGASVGGSVASLASAPTPIDWYDPLRRFHLYGDLSKPEALRFAYSQQFAIRAVVMRQEDGALRVATVHLDELGPSGEVVAEGKIDLDKSSFEFAPPPILAEPPPFHWLGCVDSAGDVLISYLPWDMAAGHVGLGFSGGGSSHDLFAGFTAMGFPSAWHRSIGFGATVGYSREDRACVRFQVAWRFKFGG